MAVNPVTSLDSMLARRKLHPDGGIILVHGPATTDLLWLLRHIAVKTGTDADSAVIVSDRIPADTLDAPGVGLMRLSGPPVIETTSSSAASAAFSTLETVELGIKDCLSRRSSAFTLGHDPATMPQVHVGVCFENIATLLLCHTFAEVAKFLSDTTKYIVGNAAASSVVVCVDAGVIGVAPVLYLEGLATTVIRIDAPPSPKASDSGYLTALQTGKERSIQQTYSIHASGSVTIGASVSAPSSAALFPQPVIPPKATAAPPASTPAGATIRSVPSTASEGTGTASKETLESTSGTVQLHKKASAELQSSEPLLFFEAGDPDHEAEDDNDYDDIDDDLDL